MRLLAICRLCPQAWTKMPPPPWEALVIDKPSMLDGLQWKLLGNRFGLPVPDPLPQFCGPLVRSVVPSRKAPSASPNGSLPWKSTPFPNTVIPAPSYAPISDGSCNCSARLPFIVVSQPTGASAGMRSTCGLVVVLNPNQPLPQPGSQEPGKPSSPIPNRQTTRLRQSFRRAPEGCVLASMMLEAAPTPCSRTGFHISNISWYLPGGTMIRSPGLAASIAD